MSEGQAKRYRRTMKKEMEAHKRENLALLIFQMQSLPFHQRLKIAWKITQGVKK